MALQPRYMKLFSIVKLIKSAFGVLIYTCLWMTHGSVWASGKWRAESRPGKRQFFYTTKFLVKIDLPPKKREISPQNAIFTKQSPLNCLKCQQIGKNALKKVQNCKKTRYSTKTA